MATDLERLDHEGSDDEGQKKGEHDGLGVLVYLSLGPHALKKAQFLPGNLRLVAVLFQSSSNPGFASTDLGFPFTPEG